ncbi:MAG: bifunctional hydroxymethylpyrimidine kinase/phosphomethylpyrimidine kinase [Nitrososphaeria archaeon]|nr:bifunctional hydroxymethylpyrimidine kinase/phosphomethylpyrimidine kinase [Nitrososphaeria archaeon]
MMKKTYVAMSIAGSDSGGGAGIEADLKTFAAFNVHGTVAITAITAQNTVGVFGISDLDLDIIEKQIDVVVEDIGVDAAKTGMLHRSEVIELVSKKVNRYGFPLVVDPVMVAKSGARLLKKEAEEALIKYLIPVAKVVTPNAMEAEVLSGIQVTTLDDMRNAAKRIASLGCEAVVVKGGHAGLKEKAVDVLYYNGKFFEMESERFETKTTHGTGCGFSAAITACLARGLDLVDAVKKAKEYIRYAVEFGINVGRGHGPINPLAKLYIESEKLQVLERLSKAVEMLEKNGEVAYLIPEVQSNLVESLPYEYTKNVFDVAGIAGRIVRVKDNVKAVGKPEFGASSHVARIVLTAIKHDPQYRACMNIKYSPKIVEVCRKLGLQVSYFDRKSEPEEVKKIEGGSLPWGVREAILRHGKMPDIIYDIGDVGKEPMIRVLGKNAIEVVEKVILIAKEYSKVMDNE